MKLQERLAKLYLFSMQNDFISSRSVFIVTCYCVEVVLFPLLRSATPVNLNDHTFSRIRVCAVKSLYSRTNLMCPD